MLQADDVKRNIRADDINLVDNYVTIRFPLRDLQQRNIIIAGVGALDETEIAKIYQKLGENL